MATNSLVFHWCVRTIRGRLEIRNFFLSVEKYINCLLCSHAKRNFVSSLVQVISSIFYINTNEIPGELLRENLISSHVKISPLLWLHNKSCLSHQKTIKVEWFGMSLVFIYRNK